MALAVSIPAAKKHIAVEITHKPALKATFNNAKRPMLRVTFAKVVLSPGACLHVPYEGEYTAVPAIGPQSFATKDRVLAEDFIVREIPYYDTSNASGGSTIYIGKGV